MTTILVNPNKHCFQPNNHLKGEAVFYLQHWVKGEDFIDPDFLADLNYKQEVTDVLNRILCKDLIPP